MEIFLFLLVLWLIVTLLGHGTWVLLRALFSSSPWSPAPGERATTSPTCPRCSARRVPAATSCLVCGWPLDPGVRTDPRAALESLKQQLARLSQAKSLDTATTDALQAAIATEEQRIDELQLAAVEVIPEPAVEPAPAAPRPTSPADPVAAHAPAEQPAEPPAAKSPWSPESSDVPVPAEQPKQRKDVSRLLAAFMEEKNIRWGELVGGLLIVGSSLALVISFWSEIASRPLLKFILFNGVTAALFGVGFYTDRRWKIHTTSHGLLVIASLLVPLNFLAIAAFTQDSPPTNALAITGEAVTLGAFALLLFFAGRIITPSTPALLMLGVIVPSLAQLLIRRWAEPLATTVVISTLAAVPIACYTSTTAIAIRRRWVAATLNESQAFQLLSLFGIVSAATLLPLGLLVFRVPPTLDLLHRLSPLVVWCGLPGLLTGLFFWQHVTDRRLSGVQTAGLSVGVLGAAIMSSALLAAWPEPAMLLPVAIMNVVALAAVAIGFAIPAALVPAGLGLVVAWLVTFHALRGSIAWTEKDGQAMVGVLATVASGHVLVPCVALFGLAAGMLVRIGRDGGIGDGLETHPTENAAQQTGSGGGDGLETRPTDDVGQQTAWRDREGRGDGLETRPTGGVALGQRFDGGEAGRMLGLVAMLTGAASIALVLFFGFARAGDPDGAVWTLAIYAVAAAAVAWVIDRPLVAAIAAGLLLVAVVQAIVFRFGAALQLERPWVVALLSYAAILVAGYGVTWRFPRRHAQLSNVLLWAAVISSCTAAGLLVVFAASTSFTALTIYLAWLAAVWTLLAGFSGWRLLTTASQVVVLLAVFTGVTSAVETRDWYAAARYPWLDPWFLTAQGCAMALYCLACNALRIAMGWAGMADGDRASARQAPHGFNTGIRWFHRDWVSVEHGIEVALVALLVVLALYGALPGVAQELAPLAARGSGPAVRVVEPVERYEWANIPHAHVGAQAGHWGAWWLVMAVAAVLGAGLWRREQVPLRLSGLLITAASLCPLLAIAWEPDVAVASALRWLTAGFFAAASIVIWCGNRFSWMRAVQAPRDEVLRDSTTASSTVLMPGSLRDLLVTIVLLMYLAMGAYVAVAAVSLAGLPNDEMPWWIAAAWALVITTVAIVASQWAGGYVPSGRATNDAPTSGATATPLRDALLLLAFGPLIVLLVFAVAAALDQHPVVGPEPASWFRRIGWDVSYGLPLVVIAATCIGYAIRDRSSGFALASGLLANVVATIVVLMQLARNGGFDAIAWVTVAQVNAIVAGISALAWLAAIEFYRSSRGVRLVEQDAEAEDTPGLGSSSRRDEASIHWPLLLITQVCLTAGLSALCVLPAAVSLALRPMDVYDWHVAAGGPLSWLALGFSVTAAGWLVWRRSVREGAVAFFAALLVAATALAAASWDTGNFLAYHTLLVGACAAAWLTPAVARGADRVMRREAAATARRVWSAPAVRCLAVAAVALALGGLSGDPQAPWWTVAVLGAISARNVWIAWHEARPAFMWIAAALANLAVTVWGVHQRIEFPEIVWANVIVAAGMAVASVWVRHQSAARVALRPRGMAYHRFAAWAIAAVMLLTTAAGLLLDLTGNPLQAPLAVGWAACLAGFAAAVACWWDPQSRWPVGCIYTVGLAAVGMYLDGLDFLAPMLQWALANALASYALATSFLWSRRTAIGEFLRQRDVPVARLIPEGTAPRQPGWYLESGHGWLVPANGVIAAAVLILVGWIEWSNPDFTQRMVAAYAVGAVAVAMGLLAHGAVRSSLQYTTLVFGVFFAVAFAWAWIGPDFVAPLLHRTVAATVALAVMIVLYGIGLVKLLRRENEWTRAARQFVPLLTAVTTVLMLLVIGIEVASYSRAGDVPIVWPALLAVALALVGLSVAALVAALVPGRDPLGLSLRGRTLYVYAAELLLALLAAHIRMTMPWLFHGWFLRFWPLAVMGIAFFGVGLSELFRRWRQEVLSEPLERTGALLPLLPALGFWITSSEVHYSLLLLSAGGLYAALSVLRKSFLFAMLAALAANGSLWYLLYTREGLGIAQHPQLWLIPPALCVLVAGHLNRQRLAAEQVATLRYGSAMVIYVSSTADIFITGVANAPWLPAVLAAFSLLGVFAGIMFRVRAFLYLGTAFLLVALLTIIWHAAIEQQRTWILWVAGIVVGTLIIAMFGLFEKRRDDVLRMVDQLKRWDA